MANQKVRERRPRRYPLPRYIAGRFVRLATLSFAILLVAYLLVDIMDRLAWFSLQAAHGLLGEIDMDQTGSGVIVCKDGFRATTVGAEAFRRLVSDLHLDADVEEVDGSSVFCELHVS